MSVNLGANVGSRSSILQNLYVTGLAASSVRRYTFPLSVDQSTLSTGANVNRIIGTVADLYRSIEDSDRPAAVYNLCITAAATAKMHSIQIVLEAIGIKNQGSEIQMDSVDNCSDCESLTDVENAGASVKKTSQLVFRDGAIQVVSPVHENDWFKLTQESQGDMLTLAFRTIQMLPKNAQHSYGFSTGSATQAGLEKSHITISIQLEGNMKATALNMLKRSCSNRS
jgi:hypothetical protein